MGLLLLDVFKGIAMSDTCPNCGSAVDRHSAYQRTSHTTKFICGGLLIEHASRKNHVGTTACDLIRGLREERDQALHVRDEARGMLDGARRNNRELEEGLQDAHRQLHRIGQRERDAGRDRIERLEEALDQSVHALRWLHCHGMTSEFENKRKAAYDLARPLLETRGVEATNDL